MKPLATPHNTACVREATRNVTDDRADVRLDGIGAEIGESGDFRVVLPRRYQGEDLGLPIGDPLAASRPVERERAGDAPGRFADDGVSGVREIGGKLQM